MAHVGSIAKGAVGGASTGAQIGSLIPGVGTAIGAGIGAIAGGVKGGVAAEKKKRAEGLLPGLEDPTQTSRLLSVDRIARNIQAGTDSATQTAIQQGAETTAATQSRLSRVTGGNVGSTVDALLKAQRAGGTAANQAIAQGQQRLPFFMNLGQQIANRSEQRKLELQLLERAQLSAESAQSQKEQNVNRNASLVSGAGQDGLQGVGGRIKSLLDNINLNRNQDAGGGDQLLNPNQNLNQIGITPENQLPSLDLGTVNPGGQEVLGLGSTPGFGAGFGG